jgi:hypothetical protein
LLFIIGRILYQPLLKVKRAVSKFKKYMQLRSSLCPMEKRTRNYIRKDTTKVARRQGTQRPLLSLVERGKIELRYCTDRWTMAQIAQELGRNKGTISREIGGRPRTGSSRYNAEKAHTKACVRIEGRGNTRKLDVSPPLLTYVTEKMELGWSPEQIAGRL